MSKQMMSFEEAAQMLAERAAGMSEEEFEVFSAPDGFVVAAKGGGADS